MSEISNMDLNGDETPGIFFNKINVLKILILLYTVTFISIFIFYSEYMVLNLVFIVLYILLAMGMVGFQPLHPIVWLLPFIFLYHYSVILLDLLNIRAVSNESSILIIGWIAISFSSVLLLIFCRQNRKIYTQLIDIKIKYFVLYVCFTIFFSLAVFHNIVFLVSGVSSKSEASLAGVSDLQFVHLWLLLIYSLILAKTFVIDKKNNWKLILIVFVLSLFSTLNLGQRDIILSYMITTGFILYIRYAPSKIYVYIMGVITLLIIPILGDVKNIFTRSSIDVTSENIFISLLSGEFLSAGRNIETLLNNSMSWSLFYGETIYWDALRTFVPGIIYTTQNSVGWFNDTFHPGRVADGYGMGFTLAGEGMINFGLLGVFIWFGILSVFLAWLYNKSGKNVIYLVIYLSAIPFFIYVLRADFSNLFSPMLKSIVVPLLGLYILNEVFKIYYHSKNKY